MRVRDIVVRLAALCVVSIGSLGGVAYGALAATQPPVLLGVWGPSGPNPVYFNHPNGVTVGPNGLIYVTDQEYDRVVVFDGTGNMLFQFGDYGIMPGYFQSIWGIASNSVGTLYAADLLNQRIQVFDPSGTYTNQWSVFGRGSTRFSYPSCVAVDDSGYVYVVENMSPGARLEKFRADGTFGSAWDLSSGAIVLNNANPYGIALDANRVLYVSDFGAHCLKRFSPSGDYLGTWPPTGSGGAGSLGFPSAVAIDSLGRVFVTDAATIRVFSAAGDPLVNWVAPAGPSGAASLVALTLDSAGNLYVCDWRNRQVLKYGPTIDPLAVNGGTTAFALQAPVPNPFTLRTKISFRLPDHSRASLSIFDVLGRRVRSWRWNALSPGSHEVEWDGRNESGDRVAPGVYLTRLETLGNVAEGRLVRLH